MHKKSLISSGIVALLAVAMVAASVGQEKITPVAESESVTEVPMTEEEANAILAKYPRIDQGMRPISELLG